MPEITLKISEKDMEVIKEAKEVLEQIPLEDTFPEVVMNVLYGWTRRNKELLKAKKEPDPLSDDKKWIEDQLMIFSMPEGTWDKAMEPTEKEIESGESVEAKMEIELRRRLVSLAITLLKGGEDKEIALEKAKALYDKEDLLAVIVWRDIFEEIRERRGTLEKLGKLMMQTKLDELFDEFNKR